jgi:signal peptidase II
VKKYAIVLFILLILILDQYTKFFIKTHYYLGEEHTIAKDWFKLHFVENEGMAWGWKLGGSWGKILLSVFRLIAVGYGVYFINKIINEKYHKGFIICVALIFAGALGNSIDSLFYGLVFTESDPVSQNVAKFLPSGGGYGKFLQGKVVDMLYFPMVNGTYPSWIPKLGGKPFEFFSPVFNFADAAISSGLITIFLFQKRFFKQHTTNDKHHTIETKTPVNDENQVS